MRDITYGTTPFVVLMVLEVVLLVLMPDLLLWLPRRLMAGR
jgi:TRAP-type C4-dicarboxylate transport system permease large subunit